jgi:hypothetical protein
VHVEGEQAKEKKRRGRNHLQRKETVVESGVV